MAGRGPAPNPEEHSHGHHDPGRSDAPDPIEVPAGEWLGQEGTLPAHPVDGEQWHPWTLEWFAMWRNVPWAAHFGPSDWSFIAETATVYDRFVRGDMRVAAELRLRTGKLGYTIEDRQRLRLKLQPDRPAASTRPPTPAPGVPSLDDERRKRMGLS